MTSAGFKDRHRDPVGIALSFSPPVPFFSTAALIAAALVLGGGTRQGLWSDAVLQLSALMVLAGCAPTLPRYRTPPTLIPLLLAAVFILLPILQLVALPPSIWSTLPGRSSVVATFQAIGTSLPWEPISLDPAATWRSALSLVVPIAVFGATLRLGHRARRSISLLFIAAGIASVVLGLGQLMQGQESQLRFFPITNAGDSVGFFANRNHYAALLYCLIPLTAAWLVALLDGRLRDRWLGLAACIATYIVLIVGLAMSRSRAGLFLAIAVALASFLLAGVDKGRIAKRGVAVISVAFVVATIVAIQFAFFGILGRLDDDILTDFRLTIASITTTAARAYLPFGSGFGTFVGVYQMFETPAALITSYVNHAHNDWLEIWLEGGWAAVGAAAAFLLWFGVVAARAWRTSSRTGASIDHNLARTATIAIVALLVHSLVDYPLRTTAIMTLFAFCCALLVEPILVPKYEPLPRTTRSGWKRLFGRNSRRRRRAQAWRPAGASG